MQLKDTEGNFILIDDPLFDPLFEFIAKRNKTLFMHIGDPPGYWLNVGADGLPDAWYKEGNNVWNRIGKFKGEVSYDVLMRSRDKILKKYPQIKIVGCHMGNLSFDIDQITMRLEKYPNYAVETSFTLPSMMGQAREKVRDFFIKNQDRIIYGSDISGGMVASPYLVDMSKIDEKWTQDDVEALKVKLESQYEDDYNYLATNMEFSRGNYRIQGLALADDILQKIYFKNAVSWIPGIDKDF
jgi:predicted TIM-barrel fold metal-dependent hydrolase